MKFDSFRKRMQAVLGSSLTALVIISPPSEGGGGVPKLYLNGCCPPTDQVHHLEIRLKLDATDPDPLSYQQALEYCRKVAQAEYQEKLVLSDRGKGVGSNYNLKTRAEQAKGSSGERYVLCAYDYQIPCIAGRLPAGIAFTQESEVQQEVGAYFAQLAYLEEAATIAFSFLASELAALQAPESFGLEAERAREDEQDHMLLTQALTQRYSGTLREVEVAPFTQRPLVEIAMDNAVEGCVRETYGTLMAMWQSLTAEDLVVRAVMEKIALDETRHAALSWEIARWLWPQLSAEEQAQCREAQSKAITALQAEIANEPSAELVRLAGFPTAAQASCLFSQLEEALWQQEDFMQSAGVPA